MDYLAQLKARLGQRRLVEQPSKPSKAPFEGFEGHSDMSVSKSSPCSASTRPKGEYVTAGENDEVDEIAAFEERAAFVEYDGEAPRPWAEPFARLHPERPPHHVTFREWRQFVDDCGWFIDRWAHKADALGWTPDDLFGWDPGRPFSLIAMRIGLGWRIEGGTVVAVSRNVATIHQSNGQPVSFRRSTSARV